MAWSDQQEAALKEVVAWAKDENSPQVFRLFGYAGTGKTTLAKEVAERVGGAVCFAAFTGKAALMLQSKGCYGASTIHSLIYKRNSTNRVGEPMFVRNDNSPILQSKLCVIDEVSMVNEYIGNDLLSFGKKILVIGDPAQLPPVRGEGFFTNQKPDVMLTEIHRQARDNPIIRLSMDIREGRPLQPGDFGKVKILKRASIGKDEMRKIIVESDQMLVGKNNTRRAFNNRMREIKNLSGDPQPGDRLVCLRNNHGMGLLNGGIWTVLQSKPNSISIEMKVRNIDIAGVKPAPVPVDVHRYCFEGRLKDLSNKERREYQEFDYGYALTVHKAQGSQWKKIVVFDESAIWLQDDARRWTYTAMTRGAEEVVWVM